MNVTAVRAGAARAWGLIAGAVRSK
jgi:hypothetical protein